MSRVIWHVTMSLDGFITGPDDSMDWAFDYDAPNPVADDVMKATGAIIAGRRWYDIATARYNGVAGLYGGNWSGPVFVLTHRPPDPSDDPSVTFLSEGISKAVDTALAAAGGKSIEILGANTAHQCLQAHLLDEIVVHIAPVLLGDGVRFYGGPDLGRVNLERTTLAESGQLVDVRFTVTEAHSELRRARQR